MRTFVHGYIRVAFSTCRSVISIENIIKASYRLKGVAHETPLQYNSNLSERYQANIYLKREDLQEVRSYKIRGAYNHISCLPPNQAQHGVVCASAGNHAQGVAYACQRLGIPATIFMPTTTPSQKIRQVERIGKQYVTVVLHGDTYDAAYHRATAYCQAEAKIFIHPFDNELVVEGQGTVGVEVLNQFKGNIDYLLLPIGGGGLSAGVGSYFKTLSPNTQIIGVEPAGAASMQAALSAQQVVTLPHIDTFVDGAAVKRVGELNFTICQQVLDDIILVPEGQICTTILRLYNQEAIVAEPAGALSIAALDAYASRIKHKNVVCVLSGGNNDIERMPDIKHRSMVYEGLMHYFVINLPQRAGSLRDFLTHILTNGEDVALFQYTKKTNRNMGTALIGIELRQRTDYQPLIERLQSNQVDYMVVNDNAKLLEYLV